jgi:hypothetical protein
MFDTCFDSARDEIPRSDRRVLWVVRIAAAAMTMLAGWAEAQIPNAPVLQNVWASPGMAGALNVGGGGGGSVYAVAGSWTPASARFQLSGGVGSQSRTGDQRASWAYGFRAAVPLASRDAGFGFGAFAGIGGSSSSRRDTVAADSTSRTMMRVPVGLAVGWRQALGSRGFSLYATPSYLWLSGGGKSTGLMRMGIGADVGLTSSIGVTGGLELGQTKNVAAGPTGTVFGLGVSYAFGKR